MKKSIVLLLVFTFAAATLMAGNDEVVGKWDCEAVVDMTYPFELSLTEAEGKLTGSTASDMGSSELTQAAFSEGTLTFQIDSPEVGIIDFEAKLVDAVLDGSVGNSMFEGSLTCKRKE
ncbi:MAG: hypothetical protein JSU96_18465 [Acidobacteriota bacterium]|nr:MAG: hypothetical protein JSU96_18465 [Acidobacteriota bacterium]